MISIAVHLADIFFSSRGWRLYDVWERAQNREVIMSGLQERITELERKVRLHTVLGAVLALVAVVASAVALAVGDNEVVRASRFEVINDDGEIRAVFEVKSGHGQMVLMNDRGSRLSIPSASSAESVLDRVGKTGFLDKPKPTELLDEAIFACSDPEILKHLLTTRGRIKRTLQDFEGCIADCTAAIQIDSDLRYAWANRHHAWASLGNSAQAASDLLVCERLERESQATTPR